MTPVSACYRQYTLFVGRGICIWRILLHQDALKCIACPIAGSIACALLMAGRDVSTVQQELSRQHVAYSASNSEQLLREYSVALLEAFSEVFDVTLHSADPQLLDVDLKCSEHAL